MASQDFGLCLTEVHCGSCKCLHSLACISNPFVSCPSHHSRQCTHLLEAAWVHITSSPRLLLQRRSLRVATDPQPLLHQELRMLRIQDLAFCTRTLCWAQSQEIDPFVVPCPRCALPSNNKSRSNEGLKHCCSASQVPQVNPMQYSIPDPLASQTNSKL